MTTGTGDPLLRRLPAVERLLQDEAAAALVGRFGRPLVVEALRHSVDSLRAALVAGRCPMAAKTAYRLGLAGAAEWLEALSNRPCAR